MPKPSPETLAFAGLISDEEYLRLTNALDVRNPVSQKTKDQTRDSRLAWWRAKKEKQSVS